MKARSLALKIVIAALALPASSLWAQDGVKGALARMNLAAPVDLASQFSQQLAIADFDGDNKPDGAVLVAHDWHEVPAGPRTIELHFSGRGNAALTFESSETALTISAVDVNGDGAPDVVVEQPLTHKRLDVWLNDGRGNFNKGRIDDFPSPAPDSGERLESPVAPGYPTLWLGSQRGSDAATLTARPLLLPYFSVPNRAAYFTSRGLSLAVLPSSCRAPPLFL